MVGEIPSKLSVQLCNLRMEYHISLISENKYWIHRLLVKYIINLSVIYIKF